MDVEQRYEALLAKHLAFYEALRNRSRRPKSAAQRQFQDVAWGKAEPRTEHEKAYVYHLKKTGTYPVVREKKLLPIADDSGIPQYPAGCHPVSLDVAKKWDEQWVEVWGKSR